MNATTPPDLVISPQVHAQEVAGETILLDLRSERYFGLDTVGSRIWQMLGQGLPRAAMVDTLRGEFAVGRARLAADIAELLAALEAAGLVQRPGAAGDD